MGKIGMIHYCTQGKLKTAALPEFLDYAAKTGFQVLELQYRDMETSPGIYSIEKAQQVRRWCDDRGLQVSQLSTGNDFVTLNPCDVKQQAERMRWLAKCALELGTKNLRTEGGQPKDSVSPQDYEKAICGCIEQCLPWMEELGITFSIDNHGLVSNDVELLLKVLNRFKHPLVGNNLDTANLRWYGHSLEAIDGFYKRLAPFVKSTHFKDCIGDRSNYQCQVLGQGEVHLETALACLKQAGYQGNYIAEYEGALDAADGYRQCREWLTTHVNAA